MRSERAAVDVVPLARLDTLGPALRSLRERAQITPAELAAKCGSLGVVVSSGMVESWERSATLPGLLELVAALVVLRASPASVFVEMMRVAWREGFPQEPETGEALLCLWWNTPLEHLLVQHAGWLEGKPGGSGALAALLGARPGEQR